jgi:thioredoxin reductase (NADPH)
MSFSVAIIGAGCAGLTAALYTARANLNPIIFTGQLETKGGLLMKTSLVENYPGFAHGVQGYDLMSQIEAQVQAYPVSWIDESVIQLDRDDETDEFILLDSQHQFYRCKSVILAMGSSPVKLGLANEERYWSKGISSCAVCDGALYKNKRIVVVGGGDTAMEEALFLTKFSDVVLIHRRDTFRASAIMQHRVTSHPRIQLWLNTVVVALHGNDKRLTSITCENVITQEQTTIPVDGLFYGLGLIPNTQWLPEWIPKDADGYLHHVPYGTHSQTIPGLFIAGDVGDRVYKQAIVAAGEGCKSALDVIKYLNE